MLRHALARKMARDEKDQRACYECGLLRSHPGGLLKEEGAVPRERQLARRFEEGEPWKMKHGGSREATTAGTGEAASTDHSEATGWHAVSQGTR